MYRTAKLYLKNSGLQSQNTASDKKSKTQLSQTLILIN